MSYNDSDDSEGQGFIPNRMIIRKRETADFRDENPFHHFQPHYITGETVIKKEPPESYAPVTHINRQKFTVAVTAQPDIKTDLPTAAQLYLTQDYEIVYSRFKKPFGQGGKASFTNEVIIKSMGRSQNFRILKNWRCDNHLTCNNCQGLKFDSKFQGGNLLCAFRSLLEIDTYILFMQNDTNTYGYNQWFYFSVREAKKNKKYTIRIVNFKKNYSFFKKGMQPYIFSLEESKIGKCGWYMDGTEFQYYRSTFAEVQAGAYYTLCFQLQFRHQNDFVMISSSLPYSYSKLIQQLNVYQQIASKTMLNFQLQPISKTLGGNQVPYVKISKRSQEKKKIILITARQHSGQTWSSYLMDQLLQGIVKQQDQFYRWVIQHYDFHVFPMINVDGVIYGNFRSDLAGYDLNRCWKDPSAILQPHVYRIRQKAQSLSDNYDVHLYLDLHTHSKEHGVFAYSCVQSPQCRRLPLLISTLTPIFRYPACTFGIAKEKKTTARSEIFEMAGNINTITIQLSAFGYRHPTSKALESFTINNIKAVAQAIINAIYYYQNKQETTAKVDSFISQSNFPEIREHFEDDEAVSGSDSEPEIDAIQDSIKIKKILRELKMVDSKVKKTRVKKLKTNMNMTTSPEPNDIEYVRSSPVNRYRAITQSKSSKEKKEVDSTMQSRYLLSSTCAPQRTSNSFKKMLKANKFGSPGLIDNPLDKSIQLQTTKPSKPLNLIQFSLKKLPIYASEKMPQAFPIMAYEKNEKNQISSISITRKIPQQQQRMAKNKIVTFYRTKREGNISSVSNVKDPFQFLCVMSQSKKKEQIQRIKERKEHNQKNSIKISSKVKFALIKQSTVLQRFSRDKKNQNETISKIWLKNFNRYSKSLQDSIQ